MDIENRVTVLETETKMQRDNIKNRLDDIFKQNQKITNAMSNIQLKGCHSLQELEKKVDSNDKFINGNGKKGAKSIIESLQTSFKINNRLMIAVLMLILSLFLKDII